MTSQVVTTRIVLNEKIQSFILLTETIEAKPSKHMIHYIGSEMVDMVDCSRYDAKKFNDYIQDARSIVSIEQIEPTIKQPSLFEVMSSIFKPLNQK
jgi:hypothetical protein